MIRWCVLPDPLGFAMDLVGNSANSLRLAWQKKTYLKQPSLVAAATQTEGAGRVLIHVTECPRHVENLRRTSFVTGSQICWQEKEIEEYKMNEPWRWFDILSDFKRRFSFERIWSASRKGLIFISLLRLYSASVALCAKYVERSWIFSTLLCTFVRDGEFKQFGRRTNLPKWNAAFTLKRICSGIS